MRRRTREQPAHLAAALDAELTRIASLRIDGLRSSWLSTFRSAAPAALSADMLARALSYRVQERDLGGLRSDTRKLLDRVAKGGADDPRPIKLGSVLVREYEGRVHLVTVVAGGFLWEQQVYGSLSTIARQITGTSWNGPRFFGLRDGVGGDAVPGPSGQVLSAATSEGAAKRPAQQPQ